LDYITRCTRIVVITSSARFRTGTKVVRIAGAVAIIIGKCSSACAVGLDYIVDCTRISIITSSASLRTSAEIIRVAGAIVVAIREGSSA
jgi:uncharacterized membrane protein